MRDYVKVSTLIYHDESAEPGAPRFGYYFDTPEETISFWDSLLAFNPNYRADLMAFRWFGYDKASIIADLNLAYRAFFNYQLFIDGYDGVSLGVSPAIFVESPRRLGFNSLTEKLRRRRK